MFQPEETISPDYMLSKYSINMLYNIDAESTIIVRFLYIATLF